MSYAGHVLAMIQRIKENRELIGKRDRFFSGMNNKIVKSYKHHYKHDKKMSAEQKALLRQKLIQENRKEVVKKVMALCVAIIVIGTLVWLVQNHLELEDFMIYGE